MLAELSMKDCRLLEKCTEKKDFLVPFIASAKKRSSLRSLSLSHNRLGETQLLTRLHSFSLLMKE